MRRIVLALFLAAGPAEAQTTFCQPYLNGVQCQQQGSNAPDYAGFVRQQQASQAAMQASIQAGIQQRQAQIAQQQAEQAYRNQAEGEQFERKAIGNMIASGHCPDARKEALAAGRFDLAEDVDRLCKPATP